jgi:predicted transcriptional regulator
MATDKVPTSFRLSDAAREMLGELAAALGLSQTAVVEMAVRKLHREELADAPAPPRGKGKKGGRP